MDNDQFNHLAQLSDIEFERERCRLIDEFLNSLPKEKRVEARFNYQDGQTATVDTVLRFHTLGEK